MEEISAQVLKSKPYEAAEGASVPKASGRRIRRSAGDNSHKCPKCHKKLISKRNLERHLRIYHEQHIRKEHNGKLAAFKCSTCYARFHHYGALEVHEAETGHSKPVKCDICQKTFNTRGKLDVHLRTTHKGVVHKTERASNAGCTQLEDSEKDISQRYKCPFCDLSFAYHCRLGPHMKQHTGEKPFPCPLCPKRFVWQSKLDYHLKSHADVKPFECELCGQKFKHTFHRTTHRELAHEISASLPKHYKCKRCNKSFSYKLSYETHVKAHENGGTSSHADPKELKNEMEIRPASRALEEEADNECKSDVSDDESETTCYIDCDKLVEALAKQQKLDAKEEPIVF